MPRRRTRPKIGIDRAQNPALKSGTVAGEATAAKRQDPNQILRSALLAAFIFLIVVPPTPFPLGPGLDSSWAFGLNMGHFDKMIFGRDIIFTYGPLGYLVAPTFPEAEPWAVFVFAWGIALLTASALWKLCRYARHWTEAGLYIGVFWICGAFTFGPAFERLQAAIIALTLVVAARLDTEPWFDLALLFFLAAVALLTKFNIGVLGLLLALCFAAYLFWRRRTTLPLVLQPGVAALMVWPGTLAGLYWILNGSPAGLASFLRNYTEVASGYSDAMAWAGPLWEAIAALLTCVVLLILVPLAAGSLRRLVWGVPPLVVISFLCFKSAMVRQDIHAVPFQFQMATAALLVVAVASTTRSRIVVAAFAIASLDVGIITVTDFWSPYLPGSMDRLTGRSAFDNLNGFLHWGTTVGNLEAATKQALARDQLPGEFLPYVTGKRVTAYPWEIAMIRANQLKWEPLPVFQMYSAYTPTLDRLDAEKLEDASGPEAILLAWDSIDARHPFYETPQSWRALINWYDLQLTSPSVYLLRHRSTPRFSPPISIGTAVAGWNERITLPPVADDEALVMEAYIAETLRGALKRTLFRSPRVDVQATLRSGVTYTGRVVRSNLQGGVLVSDFPMRLGDLAAMLTGGGAFSRDRVVSISFHTAIPAAFSPVIRIRWSRIKLRQPAAHDPESPAAPVVKITKL